MFRIEMQEGPSGPVMALSGDLDTAAAKELDARIDQLVPTLQQDLVIDLEALSYLNSTGIRSFVRLDKLVRPSGRRFVLKGPSERVMRIFEYCGLDTFFTFDQALQA